MAQKKQCNKCGIEKDISLFHKEPGGKYGVRGCCKQCINDSNRDRYRCDPEYAEREKARSRKKYKENREHWIEYRKKYYQDNRDMILEKARNNRHRYRGALLRSKRNRKMATSDGTEHLFKYSSFCYICSKEVDISLPAGHPDKAVIDHINPLSKGGESSVLNMATACNECNCRKYNKDPGDFWVEFMMGEIE